MIDIDVSEIDRLVLDLGKVGAEVTPLVRIATAKALVDTEAHAKQNAPVDTGNLRNSIGTDTDSDGMGGEVGPTADYGAYVEYGTSRMAPQPYMGPAFDATVPGYVAALETIGGRVLS